MHLNFTKLYDEYFDDVYRYVYFKTNSKFDTDDLVADIFRKAFEKHSAVKTNPKAWLMTIARNTVTDYYRKKKDIPAGDDLDSVASPQVLEEEIEKKDELNALRKALKTLDPDELEIINLRYFSELKFSEIGELLGKTEQAVKSKSFRLIKKLADMLKN